MSETRTEGGCYCGAVRYEVRAEVMHQTICYCSNCRRAAGAQSVAWVTFPVVDFAFVQGTPVRYRTETGAGRTFCGACGTPMTYENDKRPDDIDITTGSLDRPEEFPPNQTVFEDERLGWDHPGPVSGD